MDNTLPQRLERLFADLRINQIEFARKTGFGQSYISQILSGSKFSPSPRFFTVVCHEFNVNSEWLKTGKGDMYIVPGSNGQNEDAELLAKYRFLPKSEQRLIEDMINALLARTAGEGNERPVKSRSRQKKK